MTHTTQTQTPTAPREADETRANRCLDTISPAELLFVGRALAHQWAAMSCEWQRRASRGHCGFGVDLTEASVLRRMAATP